MHNLIKIVVAGDVDSGKSTLMHLLAGLDSATTGSITVEGQALNGMKEGGLAKLRNEKFGFIFQQFFLQPNLSVLENLQMAARRGREDRGGEALRPTF